MPTAKTVEVGFTFVYVDKRREYTCKDFGLKSIVIIACISTLIITFGAYIMHGIIRLS